MSFAAAPTQSAVLKALGDFLTGVLPTGTEVLQAQDNRVPEPKAANFVVMTPTLRSRISTNTDDDDDVVFTASIAADVMTVTAVERGAIADDAVVFGTGVTDGTTVDSQITGTPGGVGTYRVSDAQTVASRSMSSGAIDVEQASRLDVQLDVHGPLAGDNAQAISTLFRDACGVRRFEELGGAAVPLYCGDPRQLPFHNAEQQVETRWVVEAALQANQVVIVPQQYAGAVDVVLVDVDAVYPPS